MKCISRYLKLTILYLIVNLTIVKNAGAVEASYSIKQMTPETALKAALAVQKECRESGYQVSIAVVDRAGQLQVFLRDRYAGQHTIEAAINKAWTAVSFRMNTIQLASRTQSGQESSGIRNITKVLALGGGVIVEAGGNLYGAVGVSGAPSGTQDDKCVIDSLSTVVEELEM